MSFNPHCLSSATHLKAAQAVMGVLSGLILLIPSSACCQPALAQPSANAASSATREALDTNGARRALKSLRIPNRGTGIWSRLEVEEDFSEVSTNMAFEWRRPDGQVFRRIEGVRFSKIDPSVTEAYSIVENNEGAWNLKKEVAVFIEGPNARRKTTPSGMPGGAVRGISQVIDLDSYDQPLMRAVAVTGERDKESTPALVVIEEHYGQKAQLRLIELAGFKKDIPVLFRPLVTSSSLLKLMQGILPVRRETVIEEAKDKLLTRRLFDKDGFMIFEERPWEVCTNRTSADFVVPTNLLRLPAPVNVSHDASTVIKIQTISVSNDDVVLIRVPRGPTTLIQFTKYGTNNASYRWRSRAFDTAPVLTGSGVIVDTGSSLVPEVTAGDVKIEWHYQSPSSGTLRFMPKRASVKILPKDAFEKEPAMVVREPNLK